MRISLLLSVRRFCLPFLLSLAFVAAPAARAGAIKGTVTGPGGIAPLENIDVYVYAWDGFGWAYVPGAGDGTDAAGRYEIGGLAAGAHRIEFFDSSGEHVAEVYDNFVGSVYDGGTDILVPESGTVSNINASLAKAARIVGRVTRTDGVTPLENIAVQGYRWNGSYWEYLSGAYDETDVAGQYNIGGLAPGTHRVEFEDFNGIYVTEIYDNFAGRVYDGGTDIPVPAAGVVSNINASLAEAAKITGTVTGPDGSTPLMDISVEARRWNGSYWDYVSGAYDDTDAAGRYELGGLAAGTYRIEFNDWSDTYIGEFYSNAPSVEQGLDIAVAEASTVSNINASLDQYASLAGAVTQDDGVTPLMGVRVRALGVSNGVSRSAVTDADGKYTVSALHPGSYSARAEPQGSSGWLGQWYQDVLYVPGASIPTGLVHIGLSSGATRTNINFALDLAGRISGHVTGAGVISITDGVVRVEGQTLGQTYRGHTDTFGQYDVPGLLPDLYRVKAEAPRFQDEWWQDAHHRDGAGTLSVASGDDLALDFDLEPGQSPALIEVTSDPAGALVYLDHQPTTNITPTVLDVGEIGLRDWNGDLLAPHVVTVKKAGHPRPSPRSTSALEAETIDMHFDLANGGTGSVAVATVPAGATVYVDYADMAAGISPIVVGNLAPGSHVILLKQPAHLQARSVLAWVQEGLTNSMSIPLTPLSSTNRLAAVVRSVPPGAGIYVDYLPVTNVTDAVINWMDPASHSGVAWHSASHTILLRKNGYRPPAPRYVADRTNELQTILVNLSGQTELAVDADHDGLPDQWEDAYRLNELAPGKSGAQDDADGDGLSNEEEMRAGTHPLAKGSALEIPDIDVTTTPGVGRTVSLVFDTVPGRTYLMQAAGHLPVWINLGGLFVATGHQTVITVAVPDASAAQFYRLVVLAP